MINSLSIQNFKSWGSVQFALSPLTGLFGTNSSGKTSLLQFILMLKQTVESSDRGQVLDLGSLRSFVELGTFQDVVTNHNTDLPIGFDLSWETEKEVAVSELDGKKQDLFRSNDIAFAVSVKSDVKGRLSPVQMAYSLSNVVFQMEAKNGSGAFSLTAKDERDVPAAQKFKFIRKTGRKWDLPRPYKCYGFPDEANAYFQNAGFLTDLSLEFEKLLDKVYYLGPLRENPKRQYTWGGGNPRDVGRRGELSIEAILASRDSDEKISRGKGYKSFSLEGYVAFWLKELNLIDDFQVKPVADGSKIYEVKVRKTAQSPFVSITDVGFGVSQILPVITLCYFAPKGSILLIEQPEIHLHPSVQSGLADVFLDAIEKRGIQIILESHSEHLLKRLQRRVAEEKVAPAQVKLYFCQTQDGLSHLTPLELDLFGIIQNWPANFFGDEMAELHATAKAAQGRKMKLKNGGK